VVQAAESGLDVGGFGEIYVKNNLIPRWYGLETTFC
jgi:hypothetical protein